MSKQVQLRRGTTAQHATFTGAPGELTYDTDLKCLRVHDGVTPGGILFDAFLKLNQASLQQIAGPVRINGGDGNIDSLVAANGISCAKLNSSGEIAATMFRGTKEILTYSSTVTVDLSQNEFAAVLLTGDVTLAFTGHAIGRKKILTISADISARNITLPPMGFVGPQPTTIPALKTGMLELFCYGGSNGYLLGRWTAPQ